MNSAEQLQVLLDDAEDRLQAAVRNGDVAALSLLLDDQVVYTGPDGQQANKEEDLQAYASGVLQVTDFDEQHRTTRVVGTTGLTWILADLRGSMAGQPFSIRMLYTRTWVHDGAWRVLAAHASLVITAP